VQTPVGTIRNLPISNNVLLFALSIATSYYVRSLINHLLINKQLQAIFEHTGLNQSEAMSRVAHMSARWGAEELWLDVLNYRPIGFRSGLVHSLLIITASLLMISLALTQTAILMIAAYAGLAQAATGDVFSYYLVALPSVVAIHFVIIGALVVLCVPIKFRWEGSHTGKELPETGPPVMGKTDG
jgi:hypothetical protein